jgi:hypothetical protein
MNTNTSNIHKKAAHNSTNNPANGNTSNFPAPVVVNVNYLDNDIEIVPNNNVKPSHNNANNNKENMFSDIV